MQSTRLTKPGALPVYQALHCNGLVAKAPGPMANAPTIREAYFVQLMDSYLEGLRPAATVAESDKQFTTQDVTAALVPMLEDVYPEEVVDYLLGEGYAPKRFGNEMCWIAIAG